MLFRATCVALFCVVVAADEPHPLSDEFIDMINAKQTTWKAGRNFARDVPHEYIKRLMGALRNENVMKFQKQHYSEEFIANLPESFDPRDKWTNCPSLNEIRDQGDCGSCWAISSVEVMTDRLCIHSNGDKQFHVSTEDLLCCCPYCGYGCQGGDPRAAFEFYEKEGLVSGGEYNSSQGCRPYEIPPCSHHITGNLPECSKNISNTPDCLKTCIESYNVEYENDKQRGKKPYTIKNDEDQIRAELYENGPVVGCFKMYTDFLTYKSGVYQHVHGKSEGFHAVKIMGWGVENGTKYWLVANSWNPEWGDHGFFKMLRGKNHCGIEKDTVTSKPLL